MTPKQKLRSLKKKLERLQKKHPDINFEDSCKNYFRIKEYFDTRQEHFHLQFEIEHCHTCGKKY